MARFVLIFIALSGIFLNGYVVAKDYEDSGEPLEGIKPPLPICCDNEVLDNCPVDCPSDNCPKSRYVDQSRCPKPKTCPSPACKCGFNSRRAANGTCISTRDCPPFKCKGKNEEYNPCPPYCPGEDCSQATPDGKCHVRGRIGITVECRPACRCKKNYWRLNGVCVPYSRCPIDNNNTTPTPTVRTKKPKTTTTAPQIKCGTNEVLDNCPSDCPVNYCPKNRYSDQDPCRKPKTCPPPRCQCRFNYRRASNGSCIPTRNCPAFECNRENEEYSPCPSYCPGENCRDATPDGECNAKGKILKAVNCKPACRCKNNFWRLNGNCVAYNECSNVNTSTTENTPKTTTEQGKDHTTSKPPTCGGDEVIDNCPVQCPSDRCPKSRYDDQSRCPEPEKCRPPTCKCGFNSRRADNGTCIPTRDCPPFECNGPNEEYNPCPAYCPGENCSQATADGKCHIIGRIGIILECKPACRCKSNFWRYNGTCVPYDQCPNIATTETPPETTEPTENEVTTVAPTLTCRANEVAEECPNNCAYEFCPKSRNDGKLPCTETDRCLPTACKCGFNYRRADNGTCIPARECPPFSCDGPNEVYNPCPPICPGEDCSQATPDGRCPIFGVIGIVIECEPACRCKKNYWRLNGVCVPYKQCPNRNDTIVTTEEPPEENITTEKPKLKCGPSEFIDKCPVDCPINNCPKSENEDFKPCPRPKKCPAPACRCGLGTYRHENGSCVQIQDCPPFKCTRPNEEYRACYTVSPGENCSEALSEKYMNPSKTYTLKCTPACRCKKNHWRLNGVCVPYEKCPNICPQNEELHNCTQKLCRKQTCLENDEVPYPCSTDEPESCSTACVCKEGYLRDDNGICVLKEQCKRRSYCPEHETLVLCKSACSENRCPTREGSGSFACPAVCLGAGCACERSYSRASNGSCVPTKDCPPFDCSKRPNEMYVACAPTCPSDSCSDIGITADSCPIWWSTCKPACSCVNGFKRNNQGICVPIAECPSRCPQNEEYSNCTQTICRPQSCEEKDGLHRYTCLISASESCNVGCVCKKGYLRDDNGICIEENECKSTSYCPKHETEVLCHSACSERTCPRSEADTLPFACPAVCLGPGCACESNYSRATNGTCIPTIDCPPFDCSARPNEMYVACPSSCPGDSCEDIGITPDSCPLWRLTEECTPACRCVSGFSRNSTGICVPTVECPVICPANEEYTNCSERLCRPQNCSDVAGDTLSFVCEPDDIDGCKAGCVCIDGYLRADNGTCVPEGECKSQNSVKCTGPYEEYSASKQSCPKETCSALTSKFKCEDVEIKPGCVCISGYRRKTDDGPCVPMCECPEITYAPICQKNID